MTGSPGIYCRGQRIVTHMLVLELCMSDVVLTVVREHRSVLLLCVVPSAGSPGSGCGENKLRYVLYICDSRHRA
jgi:hypothetical protein